MLEITDPTVPAHAAALVGTVAAPRPLAGRAAIVTGATSGIGLGIARALAAQAADILLNGLGPAGEAMALAQEIARTGHIPGEHAGDQQDGR